MEQDKKTRIRENARAKINDLANRTSILERALNKSTNDYGPSDNQLRLISNNERYGINFQKEGQLKTSEDYRIVLERLSINGDPLINKLIDYMDNSGKIPAYKRIIENSDRDDEMNQKLLKMLTLGGTTSGEGRGEAERFYIESEKIGVSDPLSKILERTLTENQYNGYLNGEIPIGVNNDTLEWEYLK